VGVYSHSTAWKEPALLALSFPKVKRPPPLGFGRASGALQADSPVIQAIIANMGGRMLPAQGAVPLHKNGELVGAIGGSGATAQEDEECAQAGSATL